MQVTISTLAAALAAGLIASLTAASVQAKPHAPVEIAGTVQARQATLKIAFDSAAQQVNVRVYGVDGLTVIGTRSPVIGATFAAGQVMTLIVNYTPGAGTSNLAVQVDGQFDGKRRSRISTFSVQGGRAAGAGAPDSTAPTMSVDGRGRRIAILPAQTR
ncbi:hypothetical protein HF313_12580 [Massilia atriviolacea]|uniref:Uncharacterized protein n=1 Tax=Massilia atriviolacea TaxID=2495579 RepID=A0A430HGK3_9BURK|nr:hypothetical protein [Massilia atriviolacea]RSZ56630.1 hypothetical protein EJB06_23660 [Massilia atriviolacea]